MQSERVKNHRISRPQIKICGLKNPDEALGCVELGADAIGCVFYPPSPRNVTPDQAREIMDKLPESVGRVGVFVNRPVPEILKIVDHCGLNTVQLHGVEAPEAAETIEDLGIPVIKAVFMNGQPGIDHMAAYRVSAYLVECAGGALPGGNAMGWDWKAAADLPRERPIVLAGGLMAENVSQAISDASPDAVDVSSGVESAPGIKDLAKVRQFIQSVFQTQCKGTLRRIFR